MSPIVRIGIIGAGRMGSVAARLFARAGHHVIVCNSRGPASLRDLVEELNALGGSMCARAATVDVAARTADVVLLTVPWHRPSALPSRSMMRGKIAIDAMNPFSAERALIDLGASTSSEVTARRLTGARLVKAFNAISHRDLAMHARRDLPVDVRQAIPVAGNDEGAKHVVMRLIEDIGFAPVDTGSLRDGGRRQQPGTPLYEVPHNGSEARQRIISSV